MSSSRTKIEPTWDIYDDSVELADDAIDSLAALLLDGEEEAPGTDAGVKEP